MMASDGSKDQANLPALKMDRTTKPKLARRSNDSKVHKHPITRAQTPQQRGGPINTTANPKHQRIIHVGTKSPFMGIVTRVRKALDHGAAGMHANSSTKGLPLTARIAALGAGMQRGGDDDDKEQREEVLVRGTGRAIAKTLELAAWYLRQPDVAVSVRTMTLETVDEVAVDEDGAEEEGGFAAEAESRVRFVSCLEVGVRLR